MEIWITEDRKGNNILALIKDKVWQYLVPKNEKPKHIVIFFFKLIFTQFGNLPFSQSS